MNNRPTSTPSIAMKQVPPKLWVVLAVSVPLCWASWLPPFRTRPRDLRRHMILRRLRPWCRPNALIQTCSMDLHTL